MKLMALGLSAVLFTGCGTVDDLIEKYAPDDDEEEFDSSMSAAEMQAYITDSWSTGCKNRYGNVASSYIIEIAPAENGKIAITDKEYEGQNCRSTNEISSDTQIATVTVGEEMTAQDGWGANTLDFVFDDGAFYTMVRQVILDGRQSLAVAFEDDGDIMNGETVETRVDYFSSSSEYFVKASSLPAAPTPATAAVQDLEYSSWSTGCVNEEGSSYVERVSFYDGTVDITEERYTGNNCLSENYDDWSSEQGTYTVGDETVAKDGEGAVELNVVGDGTEYYTMVRVDATSLIIASENEGDTNDGETVETRVNDFSNTPTFTRD